MEKGNLLADFYEFTMTQANHDTGKNNEITVFDLFYRKNPDKGGYVIACGLEEVIKYIKNLKFSDEEVEYLRSLNNFTEEYLEDLKNFKFTGDIYAVPEGTVVFPNEPIVTVKARAIEAMLIETRLLQIVNFGSLIATKASRITRSAGSRGVMEFGARRAQEYSASALGAKYAIIGGCVATSNTQAGFLYGVPVAGTMAHSYITAYDDEYEAFLNYAKKNPNNCVLLIDTYNTLESGLVNAIRVAKEYLIPNGYRLKGVRLDSGDLAYLSKCARISLNMAGMEDCKIVASNGLDEYLIADLVEQNAEIDTFGVGENLITAASDPVLGGVYKLVEVEGKPKIKISETSAKITNPAHKKVVRFYDKDTNKALGDVLVLKDELIPDNDYEIFDEKETWKRKNLRNYRVRELQQPIFINGKLVYQVPTLKETMDYTKAELNTLYEEVLRFKNPHEYYVDLSQKLYDLKKDMLIEERQKVLRLEKAYED